MQLCVQGDTLFIYIFHPHYSRYYLKVICIGSVSLLIFYPTSSYALSIVLVGVGDGPWEDMKKFDDRIPTRRFDNFQVLCLVQVSLSFFPPYPKKILRTWVYIIKDDKSLNSWMLQVDVAKLINFPIPQFVNFTSIMEKTASSEEKDALFALSALMEIPFQYKATIEINLLK